MPTHQANVLSYGIDRRLKRKLKKNFEWPIINRVDTHSDLPKNTHILHDLMRMAHN